MQIFINRSSLVSLHEQLSAQIAHLIASGALAPGERLPSIRALARKLRIHHNTVLAAYQALQSRGLVLLQQGSGARVAAFDATRDAWLESYSLRSLAMQFVAQARARGHGEAEILEACRKALAPAIVTRLIVVNPHPDLQAIYLHELEAWLDLPMSGMTIEAVEATDASGRSGACYVTSTNHAPRLQAVLGDQAPLISRLAPLDPLWQLARELPSDALIAIASASERFSILLKEMLSAVCDESQLIEVSCEDHEQVLAASRLCSLLVTDALSAESLARHPIQPVFCFRLLGSEFRDELLKHLPPEAFRPVF